MNDRGIRDTARVLKMSQWLVMEELKKADQRSSV
jgi:transposase-like protein